MGAGAFIVSITGRVAEFLRPRHDPCDEFAHGDVIAFPNQFVAPASPGATGAAESLPLGGVTYSYAHASDCECAVCWVPVSHSFHQTENEA